MLGHEMLAAALSLDLSLGPKFTRSLSRRAEANMTATVPYVVTALESSRTWRVSHQPPESTRMSMHARDSLATLELCSWTTFCGYPGSRTMRLTGSHRSRGVRKAV